MDKVLPQSMKKFTGCSPQNPCTIILFMGARDEVEILFNLLVVLDFFTGYGERGFGLPSWSLNDYLSYRDNTGRVCGPQYYTPSKLEVWTYLCPGAPL